MFSDDDGGSMSESLSPTMATMSTGGELGERLRAASLAGFRGIEFFLPDCEASGLTFKELARRTEDLGLAVESLQPIRGYEGSEGGERQAAIEGAKAIFAAACELGAPLVGVCANEADSACGVDRAAEELNGLAEIARSFGLRLSYEALSWSRKIHLLEDAWQAVTRADAPNLGLVIDVFHMGMHGTDPAVVHSIDMGNVMMLQIADTPFVRGLPVKEISRHHRCYPGEGVLPVQAVIDNALGGGFSGPLTLELFSDRYRAESPVSVAAAGYRSVQAMIDAARKRRAAT